MTAAPFDEAYYRTNYPDYDRQNPRRKLDWYESAVRRWTEPRPFRLLDIGCGLGAFAAHMSLRSDVIVCASDVSDFAIAANRSRFPAVNWHVASATETPWPEETFDAVTALDVLEHLDDPQSALASAIHVLKPGGTFIAVVPVYDGPTGPLIRWLDRDPTHVNRWNREDWISLIGSHMAIADWTGIFRYLLPRGPYLHVTSHVLRRTTPAIMIVGKRM